MRITTISGNKLLKQLLFTVVLTLIFLCITLLLYRDSLASPFLWDDHEQLVNNTAVHSPVNILSFFAGSTYYTPGADTMSGIFYRPLMLSVYSLIYSSYGLQPLPFHLVQLTLHVLVSILVMILFQHIFSLLDPKRESKSIEILFISTALSLLFLIHPLHTETVIYIAVMQDPFSVFWGLLAFITVLKMKSSPLSSLLVFFFLLLTLFSKESGIIFIAAIWVWLYICNKNRLWNYSAIALISFCIYISMRCGLAHLCSIPQGFAPIAQLTFWERIAHIPAISWYYVSNFFYPTVLATGQHWIQPPGSFLPIIKPVIYLVLLFLSFLIIFYKSTISKNSAGKKIIIFFTVFIIIALFPYLHIIPLEYTVAIRWFSIPMIPFLGLIGTLVYYNRSHQKILSIIFIVYITFLMMKTYTRVSDWTDELTLFSKDLLTTKSFDLENNLGVALFKQNRYAEAKKHFLNSTKLAPDWHTNWLNLGIMYEREGNFAEAEKCYKNAVDNGHYYGSYINYVSILITRNKKNEALNFLNTTALQKFPNNTQLLMLRNQLIQ